MLLHRKFKTVFLLQRMSLRRLTLKLLKYFSIFLAIFVVVEVGIVTYSSAGNKISIVTVGFRKDYYSTLNGGLRIPLQSERANHPNAQTNSG